MITEMAVSDLGVIAGLSVVFGPGMTALTGETGAGKTLLVEAISLLVGGRADPLLVRPGSQEARVEAFFVQGDEEIILSRVVPVNGRSRAYVDGRMSPVGLLSEKGADLIDMHGQHSHQSLLSAAVQRAALDRFAGVDLAPLHSAKRRLGEIDDALSELGGDGRSRAREMDLLRFQISEIVAAAISDVTEEVALEREEEMLADATAHREAAAAAYAALTEERGAQDGLGVAIASLQGRTPFGPSETRLRGLAAEMADVAREIRVSGEAVSDDPHRLAAVRERRALLRDLRRKYGETLAEVVAFADASRARSAALESHEATVARLEQERVDAAGAVASAEAAVGATRRAAAPGLARAIEDNLVELAMPHARFDVRVGSEDPGDEVEYLLGANPGEPLLPLARVASGGELARTMLAARLVLTAGPGTLVFDEVDAGIGGEAAVAVGRALSALARSHQVLVVTHLPQVAAFADTQVAVFKQQSDGRTVAGARIVEGDDRVVELSRMLSGHPQSARARDHAEELLSRAAESKAASH